MFFDCTVFLLPGVFFVIVGLAGAADFAGAGLGAAGFAVVGLFFSSSVASTVSHSHTSSVTTRNKTISGHFSFK